MKQPATAPGPIGPPPAGSAAQIGARLDRIPINRFHVRLTCMLGAGTFMDGFDSISIAVVLAAIVSALHISLSTASFIVTADYVGQFLGTLIVGALGERIGRRNAFVLCLITMGLMSLLTAISWNATSLLIFRFVQGFGLGAEVPLAATLINEYLSARKRGRISMVYQSLAGWGMLAAPLIALLLTTTVGFEDAWRYMWGVGALPVIIGVYAWFRLPESARWLAGRGRVAEAAALVDQVENIARRRGVVLAEPEVVAEPVRQDFRIGEFLRGMYRKRTLMLWALWFCASFVTYTCVGWLPTLYIRLGGASPAVSLAITSGIGLLSVPMALLAGVWIDRFGRKPVFVVSFVLMIVGALVGFLGTGVFHWATLPTLAVAGLVIAVGSPLVGAPLWVYTAELYPTRMRGWATSASSAMSRAASIVSPLIVGAMLAANGGAPAIFAATLACAVIGLIVMAVMGVETKSRSLEEIAP